MLNHVINHLGVIFQFHFFEDMRTVGADGFDAQRKRGGDFGRLFPGTEQFQYLELPVAQIFMQWHFTVGIEAGPAFTGLIDLFRLAATPENCRCAVRISRTVCVRGYGRDAPCVVHPR